MIESNTKINNYILYFITFYFLFFHQINSLLFLKSLSINYIDSLDGIAVYKKVIANMYQRGFENINIFLNGELEWYNLDGIFRPLIIIYVILDFKEAFFFEIFLYKIFAFYSFYRLSNKFFKLEKLYAIFVSILYAEIVIQNSYVPQSILILFYPYIAYLLLKEKKINLKNYLTLIFIGSNSSMVFEFPAICAFFIFFVLLSKRHLGKNLFLILGPLTISMLIFNAYLFLNFDGTIYQRSEYTFDQQIYKIFWDTAKGFLYIPPHNLEFIFKFIFILLQFVLLIFCFFNKKNVKLFLIYFLIFFILIFFIKIFILLFYDYLPNNIRSIQYIRIQRIQPLVLLIIFINFFKSDLIKKKLKKLFLIIFCSSIVSFGGQPFIENVFRNLVYSNFKNQEYKNIQKQYFNKEYIKIVNKIFLQETIEFNAYSKLLNFDNFYKFDEYKSIKQIVKNDVVVSHDLDPMIAVANGIKSADGYFQLYPLSYKKKFRKIIEKELEKSSVLKRYFNEFGSRIYLFSHEKKNPAFNFLALKDLNIKYIISKHKMHHKSLSLVHTVCCIKNKIFLYKIV